MNRSILSALVIATFSLAGCAASSADQPTTGDDQNVTAEGHAGAVKACNAKHKTESENAGSTLEMIGAEANWTECLGAANDAAVAKIESILKENESRLAGQTKGALEKQRGLDNALCEEQDKASPSFGGSLSRVEAAACRANRESFLAMLMDAYVSFGGGEASDIVGEREAHPACYAAFDKAAEKAMATTEMMQATFGLADCVGADILKLAEPLAKIQVENDAATGPIPAAVERVTKTVNDSLAASGALCAVLNQAGENGIGSLSNVTTGSCQARYAESVYKDIKNTIGE